MNYPLVDELAAETADDDVFARYLVADRAFVETLTSAFGRALAQAPPDSRAPLATFLGVLTDEEDDYFERALSALPNPSGDPATHPTTAAFRDHVLAATGEGGYAETLAVLVTTDWCYSNWARDVKDPPSAFHLGEWVRLHANEKFAGFVGWLRGELDREFDTPSPRRKTRSYYLMVTFRWLD